MAPRDQDKRRVCVVRLLRVAAPQQLVDPYEVLFALRELCLGGSYFFGVPGFTCFIEPHAPCGLHEAPAGEPVLERGTGIVFVTGQSAAIRRSHGSQQAISFPGGEGGIRTRGTAFTVHTLSRRAT